MPGFIRMKFTCHTDPLRYGRFTCAFITRAPGTTNAMARATAIGALRSLLIPCLLSREGRPRARVLTWREERMLALAPAAVNDARSAMGRGRRPDGDALGA